MERCWLPGQFVWLRAGQGRKAHQISCFGVILHPCNTSGPGISVVLSIKGCESPVFRINGYEKTHKLTLKWTGLVKKGPPNPTCRLSSHCVENILKLHAATDNSLILCNWTLPRVNMQGVIKWKCRVVKGDCTIPVVFSIQPPLWSWLWAASSSWQGPSLFAPTQAWILRGKDWGQL